MKFGVFCYTISNNIGDEFQTLAAISLLPHVDYYVDRDNWDDIYNNEFQKITYDSVEEPFLLVGNGWQIDNPDYIRHHEKILFVPISIHLTPKNSVQTIQKLQYYIQKTKVVFTRDSYTANEFQKMGYSAEFLGCLTCILDAEKLKLCLCPPNLRKGIAYVDVTMPSNASLEDKFFTQFHEFNSIEKNLSDAKNLIQQYSYFKKIVTDRLHVQLTMTYLGVEVDLVGFYDERKRDYVHNKIDIDKLKSTFYSCVSQPINI